MYVTQNPVLQHELLANLRRPRAVILLGIYIALLGLIVLLAWPQQERLDLAQPTEAKRLVGLFFFGQYLLASLMAPSFAAGAITGEKERLSFEMLVASPLRPGAIVFGKLLAALTHLAILIFCSLPIVMLCLPLGGVGFYDVLAAYVAMFSSVLLFGMISLWASSFFGRTASALVVSYLMILPLAMLGVLAWNVLGQQGDLRLLVAMTFVPAACAACAAVLWNQASSRLLYPSDLGSGGKDAIDLETESEEAVGLYIKRDEWPDRLFAPPKRTDFLPEGANPIYDKEMRSEIFSQGTLMLRLVIQISMVVAMLVMMVCLYVFPWLAPWYISYVLLFNMLCGPVFSAGSVCSERERQTLDLLLTTLITPSQMLWGKLLSGLRVSSVLTGLVMWPIVLACITPTKFWTFWNMLTMGGYVLIIALACVTTALTALVCSTIYSKTSTSLIASYLILIGLFMGPLAALFFADTFYANSPAADGIRILSSVSPFQAAFSLPLDIDRASGNSGAEAIQAAGQPILFFLYLVFTLIYNGILLLVEVSLFGKRWRVAE